MRRSIRTTRAILPSSSRAMCPTDPRWNRAVNPYPQRARWDRRLHEAKCLNTRGQKVTASADRILLRPAVAAAKGHDHYAASYHQPDWDLVMPNEDPESVATEHRFVRDKRQRRFCRCVFHCWWIAHRARSFCGIETGDCG